MTDQEALIQVEAALKKRRLSAKTIISLQKRRSELLKTIAGPLSMGASKPGPKPAREAEMDPREEFLFSLRDNPFDQEVWRGVFELEDKALAEAKAHPETAEERALQYARDDVDNITKAFQRPGVDADAVAKLTAEKARLQTQIQRMTAPVPKGRNNNASLK